MRYIFLEKLIKENNLKIGAEIGVWYGETFLYLLKNCPGLILYGVDIWVDKSFSPHHSDQKQNRMDVLEKAKSYWERALIIEKPSVEAAKDFQDGYLDFVFIDAEHSFEAVNADIEAWSPKVRAGGFITGHDYSHGWPGVKKAVDLHFAHVKVEMSDFVWWVQK